MLPFLLTLLLSAPPESKLPLARGWIESATLKSEFATQAAAADERFTYAVSNTRVARYDRATGKLLGVGTAPDAKHLNSAFVWRGKIYCAHSNYPKTPEESDIRVYDPSDDSLQVFHTFEKPQGSLVWCIRDPADRNWWCCFAHYQADNAQTILVRMDDDFREQARWSFPEEVIADWDGMSASGGLWDGDTLLTTHHHFAVLYRLRLPETGPSLELVEALKCPYPGQGIAVDPVTPDGLVGIDRRKRLVVFAKLR
ncbi:hypothetical protein [Planctellipticum variicoloris]|uniref:hypothetical protein n=1 Tax=Planctellipticum variicoloris TaxID=3064265 RepID=UPI002CFC5437|nr:hypothetical protein SH412_002051 [Planctomycetaceae bacterium SH412]HTN03657.1 hypothetical protein [Planctomycetaceae bacterium]